MKIKLPEYISFRDVPFALVCGTVWAVVLWILEYPADESVGVALVGYVALWTSRLIVNALALFALRRLHSLALKKADELGVEIPEEPSPSTMTFTRAVVAVFAFAMLLAIVGISTIATAPIVAAIGLPPLAAGFGVFGWAAFGVGAFVLAVIFGVPFALFRWTEKVAANMRRFEFGISAIADIIKTRPLKGFGLVVNPRAR